MSESITEFLLARIAEDEVRATMREWHTIDCETIPNDAGYSYPCDCGVPERMAAECSSKRAIIEMHGRMAGESWQTWRNKYCATCADWEDGQIGEGPPNIEYPCDTLRALAAVYEDHPDYRQEWA